MIHPSASFGQLSTHELGAMAGNLGHQHDRWRQAKYGWRSARAVANQVRLLVSALGVGGRTVLALHDGDAGVVNAPGQAHQPADGGTPWVTLAGDRLPRRSGVLCGCVVRAR
jgi:hypothetical protein